MKMPTTPLPARRGPGLLALARAEFGMNVRSPGFKAATVLVVASVLLSVYLIPSRLQGLVCVAPVMVGAVRLALELILLPITPLLVCGAAVREQRLEMQELILSKPSSSQELVWAVRNWFGANSAASSARCWRW